MNIAKKVADGLGFYYGWIIVTVALISMAFWFGIRSGFSVFYVALLEDFGWNRGESAGVQSMALITYTVMAPLVGGLIDRFGPRRVVLPGILILALGLILCRTIETLTQFYLIYGVVMGTGITCIGIVTYSVILVHNVRLLVDQGVAKMTAAFIFALVGVISLIFRIFWGWLSDRIGREKTYTMGIACACLGAGSLLLFEAYGSPLFIYSFFVFFGMGWGVTAPMFMAVAADLFRGKIFGLIYGFVEAGVGIGAAFGAWVAGFIFDETRRYQIAFVLVIAALLLSCIFIWLAAPRKFRYPRQ